MYFVAEVFRDGGIWAYLLLFLLLVTVPAVLVLSGINAMVRRVPAALWWVFPSAILTVGAAGTVMGFWETTQALEMATPENRQRMMSRGFSFSLMTLGFAAAVHTICGLLAAVGCAGSSVIRTGKERQWKLIGPGIAAAITLFIAPVLLLWGIVVDEWHLWVMAIPFVFVISGLTIAALGACATDDQRQADHLASDRWTVIFMAASTVASTTILMMIYLLMEAFESLERAMPENRSAILHGSIDVIWSIALIGVIALIGLAIVAIAVAATGAGRTFSRTVIIDGVTTAVVLTPAAIALIAMMVGAGPFFGAFDDTLLSPPDGDSYQYDDYGEYGGPDDARYFQMDFDN